ncbi:mediator of RNA polymerase II transcription subunit 15 [Oryzias melastigma]|uniref:mediator of RNA polymerase II transcription subunit 15 n=1 Tax=Oryzias melastigma TaxID=30732 RepID=UPI000CF7BB94|nr:mediator of RNA polymerase II transcription subunit 15 [Oryzias melastigma]
MSLFMAFKKKETQVDVHHNQTENVFDDFLEGGENQTPSAQTAQENPSVFDGSLGISPPASAGQKTSTLSLRKTFQPAQLKPSAGTSIKRKAASKTILQQLLLRLQHRRWQLQQQQWQQQQRPNPSFPPKQPLQKPPQPQPPPQTWSPTCQTTQQPEEEPPTPEEKPEKQADLELQHQGRVRTRRVIKKRKRKATIKTFELQNPEFKKKRRDPAPFPAEDNDAPGVSEDPESDDLARQRFYLSIMMTRTLMMIVKFAQKM